MTRTLTVAVLAFLAPIAWPAPLSAADTRGCYEDQLAVWSGRTNAHTRCLDIDDPRTRRILIRKGLHR